MSTVVIFGTCAQLNWNEDMDGVSKAGLLVANAYELKDDLEEVI